MQTLFFIGMPRMASDPIRFRVHPEITPDIDIPCISIFSNYATGRGTLWAE
jgi:hypothetical protein